jgi:hypothetical protein
MEPFLTLVVIFVVTVSLGTAANPVLPVVSLRFIA